MSQHYRVEYAPESYADLKAIYSHIAFRLKEPETARGQIMRIRRAIRALNEFPERYSRVDWEPWASMGMRKLTVDHYLAFYLVDHSKKLVSVIRVFYGGRDVEQLIKEQES